MGTTRTVSEFMHAPVHTIGSDQPLSRARQELHKLGVHHLPVLEGGRCIGILSDRDMQLAYIVESQKADTISIKDACVSEVYEVLPTAPLAEVARTMAERKIGSAVVVEKGKVCGIFTVTDACRALAAIAG
jgi:acetoin utilization protein AcuB